MDQHRLLDAAQGAACLALARDVDDQTVRTMLRGYGAFSLAVAAASSPPGPAGIAIPADAWATDLGDDLACLRCGIVNVAFIGAAGAGDRDWYLVDAGVPGSAAAILQAATTAPWRIPPCRDPADGRAFRSWARVASSGRDLDAPICAHPAEHPFLTGRRLSSLQPPRSAAG